MDDLRISTVDHEAASHDFASSGRDEANAVADEISAHQPLPLSENADVAAFQVAQAAEQQANGKTDRLAANQPQNAAPQAPIQIVPDQGNVVHLPPNTSIDDIHVEGRNLVLIQADGTRIVIVNGALHVPTFLIGEVTLPQQAVVAALEQQGINVAEGPDGSVHAGNSVTSGHQFTDTQAAGPRTPLNLIGLLGPGGAFGNGGAGDLSGTQTRVPFIIPQATEAASLIERGTSTGDFLTSISTGRFGFGGNNAAITTVTLVGEAEFTGSGTQPLSGLTSNGVSVVVTQSGQTVTGVANGVTVFTLVFNAATGEFTFTQLASLDHPRGANSSTDVLQLQFQYTVSDASGHTVASTANVNIADSVPVAAVGTAGSVTEGALTGGNENPHVATDAIATGSLNIFWGADSGNTDKGGLGDRSVAFTNANVTTEGQDGATLSSHGLAVHTVLLADGTLVGYTGEAAPTTVLDGKGAVNANVVFYATLSDTDNGHYNFTLVQSLDDAKGSDAIKLTFGYTATDSDGDKSSNSFSVTVADDKPVAGTGDAGSVTEGALAGGNENPHVATDAIATGSLNISWGADNGNTNQGGAGDRSVAFTNANVTAEGQDGEGLSSHGQVVHTVLLADGTLVGYTGEAAPTAVLDGEGSVKSNVVFYATLSDTDKGHYNFTLVQSLDDAKGSDAIKLTFGYTATDSDGDKSSNSFSVTVADDKPVAGTGDAGSVNEGALPGGNENPHLATDAIATGSLNISWGADNGNTNQGGAGDRSVAFTNANVTAEGQDGEGLSSHGQVVHTVLLADGTLVGYTGEVAPTTVLDGEGSVKSNVVFYATLSDTDNGHYNFTLVQSLDDAKDSNAIKLTFGYTATDSDGDTSSNSFSVTVSDDKPVAGTGDAGSVNEGALPGGNENPLLATDAIATGSLNISWGADNANTNQGGAGDRSVAFTNANVTAEGQDGTLSSHGQVVHTVLLADGTLVGYTGEAAPTTVLDGEGSVKSNVVFYATLSDTDNGHYNFTLVQSLDDAKDSNAIKLTFGYTATDSDGDTSSNSFSVTVSDDKPVAGTGDAGSVNEGALPGGNENPHLATDAIATGSLNISWGADNANTNQGGAGDRSVAFTNANVTAEGQDGTLSSHGQVVHTVLLADGTLVGYTGEAAPTTVLDGEGSVKSNVVFYATLSDTDNGHYNFTLVQSLDDAKDSNAIKLTFGYTATDSDGDTSSNSFSVTVSDDKPVAGTGDAGSVNEGALPGGNENPHLATDAIATGSLNISWGADNANTNQGGAGDRSVAFTNANVTAEGQDGTLSSHGQAVHTVLLADGTLVGYTGEAAPTTVLDGEGSVKSNVVFYATLSDTDNGHYNFTLVQSLDDAKDSNAIKLTFGYTATDSDGDTSSNSFSVTVSDDKPVAGTGDAGSVNEGALPGGNENPHLATDAIATGSLNISWGADNANTNQGGAGDRSVAFTNANVTAEGQDGTLSSHGQAVHTVLLADGTLVGYTGEAAPTATSATNVVFYATLSDTDKGHYNFTLVQSLDDAKASDSIKLTFGYTATDSDGDTSSNSFSVTVADDKPVVTGAIAVRADEGDIHNLLSLGNNPPGGTHDGSSSQLALLGLGFAATVSGSVASTVSFGADGAAVGGGFSFTTNATSTLANLHLTSGGEALSYTVVNNVIIGYIDNDHHNGFNPLLDRPVLSLALSGNGSFTFQQYDQLDNVAGSGNDLRSGNGSIPAIDFGSVIQATDRDGDSVVLTGGLSVTIVDDVPKVTLALTGSITIDESGRGDDDVSATKAIASLFAGITGGNDSHMSTVYAQHNIVSGWVSIGADDAPGATSSLTLHIDNPDSGLKTTAGQAITLSQLADGTVIGKTAGGDIAFAIRLDTSGKVSIAQYMSLYNPDPSKSDGDLVNLSGKLSAVLSATDSDGDTVSKSVSIGGSIRFDDDGPSIGNAVSAQTLVEHNLLTGSGVLSPSGISTGSVALNFAFGADGPAAHAVTFVAGSNGSYFAASYANNQTLDATKLSSGGHALSYSLSSDGMTLIAYTGSNSGDTSSWVFKVVLSQDASHASGAYNFTLYKPLDDVNGQANLSDIRLTFQVAGHDGDGDTTKGTQSFAIDVIDDVPTLVDHAAVSATVSETAINTPVVTTGSYTIDFNTVTPATAGLKVTEGTVSGDHLEQSDKNGNIALASASTGTTFVLTQMDISESSPGNSKDKAVTITGIGADGKTYTTTFTPSDDNTTFSVTVGSPLYNVQLTSITVSPHDAARTITLDNIHVTDTVTTIPTNAPAETTLDLSSLVHASADGPMAWTVNAITAGTSSGNLTGGTGLTYNGAAITLASTDGHTLIGSAGGVTVFTLTVDPTSGHATFDLYHAIDGGKTLPLDFSKYLTATDFDGDPVTPVSGSVTVVVQSATDNLPTISSVGLVSSVSESGLSGGTGTPGVSNVHSGSIAITAGDAPSTVTIGGHTFNVGAAIASGDANANIQGTYGTLHIVSVTATAINYTYTLTGKTIGAGNHDDFSVKVSDAPIDGESQTATLTFNISDDKPIASTVSLGSMLENDNATFTLAAGTIAFGADGAAASGAIHIDSVKATGDLAGLTLNPSMISIDAGHVVITPGTAFDALSAGHTSILSIGYTLTDGDGSKTSGTFNVTINGTNDAAVITGDASGSVTEAGGVNNGTSGVSTASGVLSATDVDSDHSFTVQNSA
ncbi:DUF5801 repeats-in-toxin domain-containing protein, partial [Rhizobium lusitanum]